MGGLCAGRGFDSHRLHHPPRRGLSLRAFPPVLPASLQRTFRHVWRPSGVLAISARRTTDATPCLFWKHRSALPRSPSLNPSDLCRSVRWREKLGDYCLFQGCPRSVRLGTRGVGLVRRELALESGGRSAAGLSPASQVQWCLWAGQHGLWQRLGGPKDYWTARDPSACHLSFVNSTTTAYTGRPGAAPLSSSVSLSSGMRTRIFSWKPSFR